MENPPIQHKIEYYFVKSFLFALRLVPKKLLDPVGSGLGLLLYYFGIRKRVVFTNLKIAFSSYSEEDIRSLAKAVYKNGAKVLLEFLYLHFISPEQLTDCIEIDGLDELAQAKAENKGVVLAGAHFGNWELLSAGICVYGFPFYVYAGMQKNLYVDGIINGIRTKFGQKAISKSKSAPLEMMRAMKKKNILAMAGDLNMPHDSLFVDFFSKKAAAWPGLATYALRFGAPLMLIWNIRTGPLKYQGHIERLDYVSTGDLEKDISNVTQLYIAALEERIREYPDQYFWFNRRWKTRPSTENNENLY